jgi:hypothetical protein
MRGSWEGRRLTHVWLFIRKNRRFGGTHRLRLQDNKDLALPSSQRGRENWEPSYPDDGGDMLFRKADFIYWSHTASYPRRQHPSLLPLLKTILQDILRVCTMFLLAAVWRATHSSTSAISLSSWIGKETSSVADEDNRGHYSLFIEIYLYSSHRNSMCRISHSEN